MRLNHVMLTVRDLDASAAFYGRWFGYGRRVPDPSRLLLLTGPAGGLLALGAGTPPDGARDAVHLGFEAASPAEVRAARARFREEGVEEVEWQESRPTRVQVRDPDGYRVDLYAWEDGPPLDPGPARG